MATSTIATASEYLVKLGVQLDTANMSKFEAFLKDGRVQAAAMAAGLVALGKATYNFMKSQTEYEFSLQNLAKEKKKSIDITRAENNALKAMGMTLNEIKKDDNLKAIYKDLVLIGKETPMPDMTGVLEMVNTMRGAFYELKMVVQNTMQWMNYYLLRELDGPIGDITNIFKELRKWLQNNMQGVARHIGIVIGDLARGVSGVFKTVANIGDIIGKIPESVKLIGAAFLVLKSGPLGIILSSLALVGDLMKDYDNWKWKQQNTDLAGTKEYEELLIGLPEVWEAIDGASTLPEKMEKGFGAFNELIFGKDGNIFTFLTDFFQSDEGAAFIAFGQRIFGYIIDGIKTVDDAVAQIAGALFGALGSGGDLAAEVSGNPVWGVVGTSIIQKLFGADGKQILITSLAQLFAISEKEGASDFASDLADFGANIWDLLTAGLRNANRSIGTLIDAMLDGIVPENDIDLSKHATLFAGISETIASFIFGGPIAGIGTLIANFVAGITGGDFYKDQQGHEVSAQDFLKNVMGWDQAQIEAELANGGNLQDIIRNNFTADKEKFGEANVLTFAQELGSGIEDAFDGIKTAAASLMDFFTKGEGKDLVETITKAFSDLWTELTKEDGILSDFAGFGSDIVDGIAGAFAGLWEAMQPYLDYVGLMLQQWIYEAMPEWARDISGVGDFRKQEVRADDGSITTVGALIDAKTDLQDVSQRIKDANNDTELIARKSNRFTYKEGGRIVVARNEFEGPSGNEANMLWNQLAGMVEEKSSAGDATGANAIMNFMTGMIGKNGKDAAAAMNQYITGMETASEKDMSAADKQVTAAEISMEAALTNKANAGSGEPTTEEAWGGRIGSRMDGVTVGEDGAEYIIPITKPQRAANLISQMFSEMGLSASNFAEKLGIGGDPATLGGALANGIDLPDSGTVINYYNNVTANTTINVQGTGDAKDIGTAAYNAHERYLLRTLKGVYA